MSHEVETMAYANEVPWHGLGNNVDPRATPEEMLVAAGLNWRVNLLPMMAVQPDGSMFVVPGRFALTRETDNRVYSITGKSWKPLQNADMLGFMRDYVDAGGATLETAGSLRNGRVVWGLARLNHNFSVSDGDQVRGYLLITSPHEVGKKITVRTTGVRVVCANTMAMAERHSTVEYRQNHLSEFNVRAAREAVESSHEWLVEAETRAKRMRSIKLGIEDAITKVFVPCAAPELLGDSMAMRAVLIPEARPKKIEELVDSLLNAPGAEPETGWGVYNAVTHWADHMVGRNRDTRMFRAWIGDTARLKRKVEDTILELA